MWFHAVRVREYRNHLATRGAAPAPVCAVAVLFALVLLPADPAHAQQHTIDVGFDQTATVAGRFRSLRDVIEDLCWRAGVELRSYDADDRPFSARIEAKPLAQALVKLLRHESFMIGSTVSPDGRATVVWLRVLGDHETAKRHRASGSTRRRGPGIYLPPTLVEAAFATGNSAEQTKALRLLVQRIESDPSQRQAFLSTDSRLIAETLARYPAALATLKNIDVTTLDPSLRAKLADLIRILAAP